MSDHYNNYILTQQKLNAILNPYSFEFTDMYFGPSRKKLRLESWNYSRSGYYFVTICCKNMQSFFGNIQNNFMILNSLGLIAHQCFNEIPHHFSDVKIDFFVVMPNHIHGIVIIENDSFPRSDQTCLITTRKYQKLPQIIGAYKAAVTKKINRIIDASVNFKWQKSYHDRIIRNENELNRIRQYIIDNPKKWNRL